MTKVKLSCDLLIGNIVHRSGEVVEVEDSRARDIVLAHKGELVTPPAPPKPTPAPAPAPAPAPKPTPTPGPAK